MVKTRIIIVSAVAPLTATTAAMGASLMPASNSPAPWGGYALGWAMLAGLVLLASLLALVLRLQQRVLLSNLAALQTQQRSLETTQLMERFIQQAEALLAKESLDPSKRSVQRCLAIDALRGNTGRDDPSYHRLARLFEWLAREAERSADSAFHQRLIEPVLYQYADIADQLCRVGELPEAQLGVFRPYLPSPVEQPETAV